ncbi:hypothetical protein AB0E04_26930 [Streptomyces sp. NPDC048251]|uniref:hypothetical protein n=1 Tax=Streptomyces sp. NPDC048251 TaxID=3154501 RepID=UPI003427CB58
MARDTPARRATSALVADLDLPEAAEPGRRSGTVMSPPGSQPGAGYLVLVARHEGAFTCGALSFERLPKHVERTHAKVKRLVTLGILSEAEPGTFSKKQ